jgi:Type IX secretion system membrane protein PorP/SprF
MLKIIITILLTWAFTLSLQGQVTATNTFFQYSMTPFQATSLPYNYLDKFDRRRGTARPERGIREDTKTSLGWYVNAGTHNDYSPQSGLTTSALVAVDKISDPNRLNLKIGGGILYNDLDIVQITSPFVHATMGHELNETWRVLGGAGYRFSAQRLNPAKVNYRDLDDPKIAIAMDANQTIYHAFGVSAAAVHIERMYLGIGVNRILSNKSFATATEGSFTETNFLGQFVLRGRYNSNFFKDLTQRGYSLRTERPNRGLFTNVNMSIAMRYLHAQIKYPFYAQLNCRTTLSEHLWTGLGWNTSKRVQFLLGFMKIPVFKLDESRAEYHIWVGYDLPNNANPQHGIDLNVGYFF